MFKLHVIAPVPSSIENIQYYKDWCGMHGPLFFHFNADLNDIRIIINIHELIPVSKPVDENDYLNDHIQRHTDWWKSASKLNDMEIYTKSLLPKSGWGDPQYRYLFFQGREVFFVTSGFFNPEEYTTVDPSAKK